MKKGFLIAAAAVSAALLAGAAGDPPTVFSGEVVLDTRTQGGGVPAADAGLDSRGLTVDVSDETVLNTRKVAGTLLLLK
ncbi:MAG: hypothetical protein LBW77_07780 [Verrucomicrobiota bacterium]|jgi:hypothetical protein|nr:hypothetical protein [Verrucomicrobiota bacterium]